MAFEISAVPIITHRRLDDSKLIITINTEAKRISIESVLEDEYDTGIITRQRPSVVLRDDTNEAKYTNALNRLLPDPEGEELVWANPRRTLTTLAMEILSEELQNE